MGRSEELFERAKKVIPGGVNSPVRAFGSVGLTPRFISRADRQKIYDADGRAYTDYVGSWGPMILGHNHPVVREAVERAVRDGLSFGAATEREVEMAELVCGAVPSVELVRMVNSGTEAVMSAVRALLPVFARPGDLHRAQPVRGALPLGRAHRGGCGRPCGLRRGFFPHGKKLNGTGKGRRGNPRRPFPLPNPGHLIHFFNWQAYC